MLPQDVFSDARNSAKSTPLREIRPLREAAARWLAARLVGSVRSAPGLGLAYHARGDGEVETRSRPQGAGGTSPSAPRTSFMLSLRSRFLNPELDEDRVVIGKVHIRHSAIVILPVPDHPRIDRYKPESTPALPHIDVVEPLL